jgi:uncharacterized protein (DUF58 family)
METAELLKRVRKIEIKTRGLTNHIFAGQYHSAFKGRGMSFSEVREYNYGDDIRAIDWNVTARMMHPFVKIFEEERELTVILLVDVSQSSYFGTRKQMKNEMTAELSAILSFSAIRNNDKVGVIFFTDRIEKFIPPKKGTSHILRIIRELIDFHPVGKGTDIELALRYLNNVMKKKSIVFLMSDFMGWGYEDALNIAKRRHDIVGLHTHDIRETELPNIGLVRIIDPETNKTGWLDTSSHEVRLAYGKWFRQNVNYCKSAFIKAGADLVPIRTDEDYLRSLIGFFRRREKRR